MGSLLASALWVFSLSSFGRLVFGNFGGTVDSRSNSSAYIDAETRPYIAPRKPKSERVTKSIVVPFIRMEGRTDLLTVALPHFNNILIHSLESFSLCIDRQRTTIEGLTENRIRIGFGRNQLKMTKKSPKFASMLVQDPSRILNWALRHSP